MAQEPTVSTNYLIRLRFGPRSAALDSVTAQSQLSQPTISRILVWVRCTRFRDRKEPTVSTNYLIRLRFGPRSAALDSVTAQSQLSQPTISRILVWVRCTRFRDRKEPTVSTNYLIRLRFRPRSAALDSVTAQSQLSQPTISRILVLVRCTRFRERKEPTVSTNYLTRLRFGPRSAALDSVTAQSQLSQPTVSRILVLYEPELFPGLIYRMKVPKVVLLIFVSGKVVLTGAKMREEIYEAFENIYPIVQLFRKGDANIPAGLPGPRPVGLIASGSGTAGAGPSGSEMGGPSGSFVPPPSPARGAQLPPPTPSHHGLPPPTPMHPGLPPPTPMHHGATSSVLNLPPPTPLHHQSSASVLNLPPPTPLHHQHSNASVLNLPPPTPR
eukprot:gene6290-2923_t